MRKTLDIIVPCYNEEACVGLFYREVCAVFAEALADYGYMLYFIDDGSSDGTLALLKDIAAQDPEHVRYLSFSRNQGKEAAIYAGLENSRGEYVVVMDADLQHPPAMLVDMLHAVDVEGYDSCAARREDRKGEGAIKRFCSMVYYRMVNQITMVELVPGSTDFRLMRRQMADAVVSLGEYERFTKGLYAWVGFRTKWISYHNVERAAGKSKWSLRGLVHYALSGLLSFAKSPIRFAVYLGALSLLGALVYGIWLLVRLLGGEAAAANAPVILLLLFFGGMGCVLLGVIGEYLARILMEVKRRPIYIIRESNLEERKTDG